MLNLLRQLGPCTVFICSAAAASQYSAPEHKVGLRLHISKSGGVENCTIAQPSDRPDGDEAICRLMSANGRLPVAGLGRPLEIETTMRWKGNSAQLDRSYQPDDVRLVLFPKDRQSWLGFDDYPNELLNGKAQRTDVRYLVNPSGRISDCSDADGPGNSALALWACDILKGRRVRARGVDAQGGPASYYTHSVLFWTSTATRVCDAEDACSRLKSWTPDSDHAEGNDR